MKMKKMVLLTAAFVVTVLIGAGCTSPVLATGRYAAEVSGREDYAMVYQDMIFLHVKTPRLHSDRLEYWDWAGKYELDASGNIVLDMPRDEQKLWGFYYTFISKKEGIVLNDVGDRKGYLLRYHPTPKRRSTSSAIPDME